MKAFFTAVLIVFALMNGFSQELGPSCGLAAKILVFQ